MDDSKEISCGHYPLYNLLIMKSDFIFYLILLDLQAVYIQKKDMQEVNVLIWFSNDRI